MPSLALRASRSLLNTTGAAWNLFLVNTAAAAQGRSDASSARSGRVLFEGLTPTSAPPTRKPCGYVPDLGMSRCREGGSCCPRGAV